MNEEVENMVRRALEDEAESYRPGGWAQGAVGVREQIAGRRRRFRNTVAVSLAVAGTAAAAVLGVVLTQAPRSVAASPASSAASGAKPFASTSAGAHKASAGASASASASASTSASTSTSAITWPTVRIVQPGARVVFEHQIWMRLTASQRCEGMGLPHGSSSCKSVTDGNQPQGTVGLQSGGDVNGQEYSPLYIGPGDVARMTVTVGGVTYPVNVVKLAGHPGYATGYLWLPNTATPTKAPTGSAGIHSMAFDVRIAVYDANGKVLATLAPPK